MVKSRTTATALQGSKKVEDLRSEWRTLYATTLPQAASDKLPSQAKWPVSLDHCFARIILDAVTEDTPWMNKIKSPAYKHMTEEQLRRAIQIGHELLDGKANLVELDEKSLALRGKKSKVSKASPMKANTVLKKRSAPNQLLSHQSDNVTGTTKRQKIDLTQDEHIDLTKEEEQETIKEDREELEAMIDGSEKTDFQKRCLKLLCQVPEGHFSTYGAMAKALGSAPRAVGNAMRDNPFAPRVPCHRILAADRTIGGYGGSWGVEGKHYNKKLDLLTKEGVKFDSKGKVKGPVFEDFESI